MPELGIPDDPALISSVKQHGAGTVEERLLGSDELAIDSLIAYALYSKYKREWADAFASDNGSSPDAVAYDAYDKTWTSGRLSELLNNSREILRAFSSDVSKETIEDFEKSFRNKRNMLLYSIAGNMISAFIFIFISYISFFLVDKFDVLVSIGDFVHSQK